MSLTPDERTKLQAILRDAFRTPAHFESLAQTLEINPNDILPLGGIGARLDALIDDLEARGQIQLLLEKGAQVPGWEANIILRTALENILNSYRSRAQLVAVNTIPPFEFCFLNADRPFIDRQDFRKHAANLALDNGRRFLLVNGPQGAGKTHSYYLLESAAPHLDFRLSIIEIDGDKTATKLGPDAVAGHIARDLLLPDGGEEMPLQQNVHDRWAEEICQWLKTRLLLSQRRCWIVLDGFDHPDLPPETRQLITMLVEEVDRGLNQVRLVLLDFPPRDLPSRVRPFTHREELHPIDRAELEAFFGSVFKHAGIEATTAQIDGLITKILANLPADLTARHEEIMVRVMETKMELFPDKSIL